MEVLQTLLKLKNDQSLYSLKNQQKPKFNFPSLTFYNDSCKHVESIHSN